MASFSAAMSHSSASSSSPSATSLEPSSAVMSSHSALRILLTRTRRRRRVEGDLDQLSLALHQLFIDTGGDVSLPADKPRRIELLDPRWSLCEALVDLLDDILGEMDDLRASLSTNGYIRSGTVGVTRWSTPQVLEISALPMVDASRVHERIQHLQGLTAKTIVVMRNLGREEVGNTRLFQLQVPPRIVRKIIRENPASSRIVAASFGFLWSQILRKVQGRVILQENPLGLLQCSLDALELHSKDTQVLKYGIGCIAVAVSCLIEEFPIQLNNSAGVSFRVHLLAFIDRFVRDQHEPLDLTEQLLAFLAKSGGFLSAGANNQEQLLNIQTVWCRLMLASLSRFGWSLKPKTLEFCLSRLDAAIPSAEHMRIKAQAVLSKLYDSHPGQSPHPPATRDTVRQLMAKFAKSSALTESARSQGGVLAHILPLTAEAISVALDPKARFALVSSQAELGSVLSLFQLFPSPKLVWRRTDDAIVDATSMCFSGDSANCAIGTARGDLFLLHTATGQILHRRLLPKEADPEMVWFISFVDGEDDSAVLFGQGGFAKVWDLRNSNVEDVCEAHRLSSTLIPAGNPGSFRMMFISIFHHMQQGGDHFERSETQIFQLARSMESPTREIEMVFCQDLAEPGAPATLLHGIAVSSRWALTCPLKTSQESPMIMWGLRHGIPLRKIISPIFLRDESEIESCYSSMNGSRCLLVSDSTGEACLLDMMTSTIIARADFKRVVSCESLSADGSFALFQLEDEPPSNVFVWDFFHEDRERMLTLAKVSSAKQQTEAMPVEILMRVKQFLI